MEVKMQNIDFVRIKAFLLKNVANMNVKNVTGLGMGYPHHQRTGMGATATTSYGGNLMLSHPQAPDMYSRTAHHTSKRGNSKPTAFIQSTGKRKEDAPTASVIRLDGESRVGYYLPDGGMANRFAESDIGIQDGQYQKDDRHTVGHL